MIMNLEALKDLLIKIPILRDQSCAQITLTDDPVRVVLIHIASCFSDIPLKFALKFMQ